MKKKAIIYLGGGSSQKHIIKSLKKKGIKVILIDRNFDCESKDYADFFLNYDLRDYKKIIQNLILLKNKFEFILTYGVADYAMATVAKINEKFTLRGLGFNFVKLFINKENSKKIFRKLKISTPKTFFYGKKITNKTIHAILNKRKNEKIVIKSVDQNNSKGVSVIQNFSEKEIKKASKNALKYSKFLIIEEYIEGKTYSVDCLLNKKNSKIISTSLNLYEQGANYKNNLIVQPSDLNKKELQKLNTVLKNLFKEFKNYIGPLTIDFIVSNNKFYFIEMSPHFHNPSGEILRGNKNPILSFINFFLIKKIKNKIINLKKIITCIMPLRINSENIKLSNQILKNQGLIDSKVFSKNAKRKTISTNTPIIIYFKYRIKSYKKILHYLNTNIKIVN
jgi:carbamoylphosphate synthase large subunit